MRESYLQDPLHLLVHGHVGALEPEVGEVLGGAEAAGEDDGLDVAVGGLQVLQGGHCAAGDAAGLFQDIPGIKIKFWLNLRVSFNQLF